MKTKSAFALVVLSQLALVTFTALAHPGSGIVVDARGWVYFNEAGDPDARLPGSIWQIDPQGKLTRLKVGGAHYLTLDTKRALASDDLARWFSARVTPWLQQADTADARLIQADGQPLASHRDGSLYFAKRNVEVVRLAPDGKQTTLSPTLEAAVTKLGGIKGLAFGPADNLYASCPSAIIKVKPDGTFSTVANPITLPNCDEELPRGTPREHASFLRGLAVDARGTVFAAATGCRAVVKISADGNVSVVMRAEAPWSPTGVAVHGNDVYVLEYEHPSSPQKVDWVPRVRKLASDGKVTTLVTLPTAQSRPVAPERK
jgi:sugar lactone lactonase YvrE